MLKLKRIGILTGGGDSAGINACIRAIVRRAEKEGIEVVGFKDGWRGPLDDEAITLTLDSVSGILPQGGTILGTSRTNPFRKIQKDGKTVWEPTDKVDRILANLKKRAIDALIPIGGDDTLGVAWRLNENYGVNVVGIPQTIDNDVAGTDYSLGFHSALAVVTEALDRLHTTAQSHHRVFVVEVMGRDSGWIALLGGIAGGGDVILVPEEPFSVDEVVKGIQNRLARGRTFSIIVVAEGARPLELGGKPVAQEGRVDAFGHVQLGGIGYWLADRLRERGMECRVVVLGHLQRGGIATPFDRLLATRFGVAAVEFALQGKFGVMVGLRGHEIVAVPLREALPQSPKPVDPVFLELARAIGVR
jgi:6-phosphofructokinase 1